MDMSTAKLRSGLSVCTWCSAVPPASTGCRIYFCSYRVFLLPLGSPIHSPPLSSLSAIALGWEGLFFSSLPILARARLHPMAEQGQDIWLGLLHPTLKGIQLQSSPWGSRSLCCEPINCPLPPSAQRCGLHFPQVLIPRVLANKLPAHRSPSASAAEESDLELNNCSLHSPSKVFPLSFACESRGNSLPMK